MNQSSLFFRSFLLLLTAVSIAFIWVLLPYYGAIFWGAILAVIFHPLNKKLLAAFHGRPNLAALVTLLFIILMVILPTILIFTSLAQEGVGIYKRIESGEVNFGRYLEQITAALPPWAHEWMARLGIDNPFGLREKLAQGALQASRFVASQAVNIGQNTFQFLVSGAIMLYLLFFLLRDGVELTRHSKRLIPLSESHQHHLFRKFTTVVRATVKGNIAVAITQGILGGLIFWALGIQGALLWGVVMTFLSLLPAVGAALIWLPVAIYSLVTGDIWEGVTLILFGVLVIGLVDNILRPLLVGKDTKLPDYIVLISTLGGLAVFGLNGFVIGPLFAALFMACWDLFPSAIQMHQQGNSVPNSPQREYNAAARISAGDPPREHQPTE
ncbi:AI-2E family transporter [Pusillimonas sp. TS35]|uniref:AI-2E family transporter n=1 Tax=Paracandidimonas lactea TaxID=2895524 RepID=UPI00136EF0AD|nr:AI-2E family transporter [Paracandidimonas lactea]MYN11590.1 AI-2E family transporter [Pusillimonas sp. TS35]